MKREGIFKSEFGECPVTVIHSDNDTLSHIDIDIGKCQQIVNSHEINGTIQIDGEEYIVSAIKRLYNEKFFLRKFVNKKRISGDGDKAYDLARIS